MPLAEVPAGVVPPPAAPPPVSPEAQSATTTVAPPPEPTQQALAADQASYTPDPRCGLIDHSCKHLHLEVALDGGGEHIVENSVFGFNDSTGKVTSTGPAWGARVGTRLTSWFGLDLHYIGMNNHVNGAAASTAGGTALLTSAATFEIRFIAPIPYVQPYIVGGIGFYHTSVTGSDAATAKSPFFGGTSKGSPVGFGIQVPIKYGVTVGGEAIYHRMFGEVYSRNDQFDGGDFTSFTAVVRAAL